tara:strand:+ start:4112 stop:4738 length:627 start_codon:yes stop_codon:yes gene_type:complete
MATTTFNGPVRSENGFQTISKNATTGAITVTSGDKMAVEGTESAGIEGTASVYVTQVERLKSDVTTNVNIVTTSIMIDLTGLYSGGGAGDIIGKDGAGVAFIGQVTTANQGTVFGVKMTCLEAPAAGSGDADIDLYSATEGTGVNDEAIADLTETQIINGGTQAAGTITGAGDITADQYLYLVSQGTGNTAYTAGRLLIEIIGYDVAS